MPTPFAAVMDKSYTPPVPTAAVPESVAVPSPLSWNVTPEGNTPVSVKVGAGYPVVVTPNDSGCPVVNDTELDDVIAGGWST